MVAPTRRRCNVSSRRDRPPNAIYSTGLMAFDGPLSAPRDDDFEPPRGEGREIVGVERQERHALLSQRALGDDSVIRPPAGDSLVRGAAQQRPISVTGERDDPPRLAESNVNEAERVRRREPVRRG